MKMLILGILILMLSACNVAEQKAIEENSSSQSAQNEKFDITNGQIFIGFSQDKLSVDEDTTNDFKISLYRSGDTSSAQVVNIQILESLSSASLSDIVSITDQDGDNVSIPAGTDPIISITFDPNDNQMKLSIDLNDDSIYEGDELLHFKILPSSGDFEIATHSSYQLVIRDDEDPPYYYVANSGVTNNSTIAENTDFDLSFVIGPNPTSYPIKFNLSYSGSANLDEFECNYPVAGSPLPTSVTVAAGSTFETVTIESLSDTYAETSENLVVTVTSVTTTPLAELGLATATYNLYNNLQDHTINVTEASGLSTDVNFTTTCASIDEDDQSSACTISVTLDDEIDEDTFVDLSFSGTATLGQDFKTDKNRLYFYKDQGANQVQSFTITPLDDNFYDAGESLTITLSPSSRLTSGATNTTTINVNDDEAAVTVGFPVGNFSVIEGSSINIPVALNNPSFEDIEVNYSISTVPADSASIGVDHNLAASGTFLISAGSTTSNTTFITFNDSAFDDKEVIYLTLNSVASGSATLSASTTLAITIRESGSLPVLTFSENDQTVQEGDTLTVTLNTDKISETGKDYTILLTEVSTDSNDYTYVAGVFNRTFPASSTTDTFTITIDTDSTHEPTESFVMTIISADDIAFGQYTSQYINVLDDTTLPQLDVAASAAAVAEGSTEQFRLTLDNASGFDISVPYTLTGTSTEGVDFILTSGSALIPKGTANIDIDVTPLDDNLYEGTETVILTIGANASKYTIGTSNDSMNITDAQPVPTVGFEGTPGVGPGAGFDVYYPQIEGDIVNIPITLNPPASSDIDVTMLVEDKWGGTDNCGAKCASVFNYDSIHKNLAQVSLTSAGPDVTGAQVGTSNTYRVTFNAIPAAGTINIDYNDSTGALDGTSNIALAGLAGADINATCDNLVTAINNNSNGFIRTELYAFHKTDTDYVDIKPRPRFLDTDIDQYISGDEITITIPAGNTQGVISFNALDDDLYELTTDERFRLTITGTTGGATINGSKDVAGVVIEDVHEMPRAQFVQKTFARTEPQTDATAVIPIPVYLSNYSEIESDYLVTITHDPTDNIRIGDENDFIVYDTLSKINLEASSVYNRIPGTISSGLVPTISEFPVFIYNETEVAFDRFNDGDNDATISDIKRKDSVLNPNNIVTQITFDAAGNGGDFDLLGLTGTVTVDIDTLCGGCTDTATATAVANWINTNYPDDLIATAVLGTLELQPAYLPALRYTSNVIKTFRIKVPAGQNVDYIPLEIINDKIYEGTEKISITLSQISGATPPVNTSMDAFGNENNIATLTINDDENISTFEITSDTGLSEPETTTTPRTNIHASSYSYNTVNYTITISPLFQHSDIDFEVNFTGDMTYDGIIFSPSEFMLADYGIDLSSLDSNYTSNDNNGVVEITYPAGYTNGTITFAVNVHADYRHEEDETLTANLANNNAGDIGSNNSTTTTFTDDDSAYPLLKVGGLVAFPISQEEYQEQTDDITVVVTDSYNFFYGEEVIDKPVSFDTTKSGNYRHTTGTNTLSSSSTTLNSSNNYTTDLNITQLEIGDFRSYTDVEISITNITNANFDSFQSYFTLTPEYQLTYAFDNIADIKVVSTTGGWGNSTDQFVSTHTCTIHRGLLSCFGANWWGKLGKEISAGTWGGNVGEDITDQNEVLDLGTNIAGNPLYVKDVSLGTDHMCALFTNNKVKCWGRSYVLGLGISNTSDIIGDEVGDMGDNLPFVNLGYDDTVEIDSIHASITANCVFVSTTGTVRCWGRNSDGILGLDMATSETIGDDPSEMGSNMSDVLLPDDFIVDFKMGPFHACIRNFDNEVKCWGNQEHGRLGNGQHAGGNIGDAAGEMAAISPIDFSSFGTVTDMSLGANHTCFITGSRSNFNTRCVGSNYSGQLGLGRVTKSASRFSNQYTWLEVDNNASNLINVLGVGTFLSSLDYLEKFEVDGARDSNSYSIAEGSALADMPSFVDVAGDRFDADTSKNGSASSNSLNQHVQVYYPAQKIKAGVTFTCAKYDRYLINGSIPSLTPNIRCWGSNFGPYYPGWVDPNTTDYDDMGLLNNVGWSKYFDGTHLGVTLPPFRNTYNGSPHLDTINILASGSGQRCVSNASSPLCNVVRSMSDIGKDSFRRFSYTGNEYIFRYYEDPDNTTIDGNNDWYDMGWLDQFEGTTLNLNFELNHAYSMVNIDFSGYNDVDITDGMYTTCALPRSNSPSHVSGSNNEFQCWGANYFGQAGVQRNQTCSGESNIVGSYNACGTAVSGEMKSLDYSF